MQNVTGSLLLLHPSSSSWSTRSSLSSLFPRKSLLTGGQNWKRQEGKAPLQWCWTHFPYHKAAPFIPRTHSSASPPAWPLSMCPANVCWLMSEYRSHLELILFTRLCPLVLMLDHMQSHIIRSFLHRGPLVAYGQFMYAAGQTEGCISSSFSFYFIVRQGPL